MGATKRGAVWYVATVSLLQGCFSLGQAGHKAAGLDVFSLLSIVQQYAFGTEEQNGTELMGLYSCGAPASRRTVLDLT